MQVFRFPLRKLTPAQRTRLRLRKMRTAVQGFLLASYFRNQDPNQLPPFDPLVRNPSRWYRRPDKPIKRSTALPPKLRLRAGRITHIRQQINVQKETHETT